MAKKKAATPKVEAQVETPVEETKTPRVTARMSVIAFLTKRGPGEFTVPEVRDACGLVQQHAFSVVSGLVETGVAKRIEKMDDRKRGKRGTYNFDPKYEVKDGDGNVIEPFMNKAAASQKCAKVKASGKTATVCPV